MRQTEDLNSHPTQPDIFNLLMLRPYIDLKPNPNKNNLLIEI